MRNDVNFHNRDLARGLVVVDEQISLGGADGKLRAHLRPEEKRQSVSEIDESNIILKLFKNNRIKIIKLKYVKYVRNDVNFHDRALREVW